MFKIRINPSNDSYFAIFCFILVRCQDVLHNLPGVQLPLVAPPLLVQLEGQVPRVEEQEQSGGQWDQRDKLAPSSQKQKILFIWFFSVKFAISLLLQFLIKNIHVSIEQ